MDYLQKYYTAAASKILFLVVLCFLVGCRSSDEKPEGLLPAETMAQILSDQLLGEAYAAQEANGMGVAPAVLLDSIIYPEILRKYDLDTTRYKSSLAYYENDPQRLKSLFVEVEKILKEKDKHAIKVIRIEEEDPHVPEKLTPEMFRELAKKRMGGKQGGPQ